MKIEKISDNQIRCLLTKDDLEARHMRLSELAYGTDKAKSLFREMMLFANDHYGFEAENFPLMIEAVPLSSEAILLIVTKVEYPEELDSRFAHYSDTQDDEPDLYERGAHPSGAMFPYQPFVYQSNASDVLSQLHVQSESSEEIYRCFMMHSIDDAVEAAYIMRDAFAGESQLYKGTDACYYLILSMKDLSPQTFNKICNMLTEYAVPVDLKKRPVSYLKEHGTCIFSKQAVSYLSQM